MYILLCTDCSSLSGNWAWPLSNLKHKLHNTDIHTHASMYTHKYVITCTASIQTYNIHTSRPFFLPTSTNIHTFRAFAAGRIWMGSKLIRWRGEAAERDQHWLSLSLSLCLSSPVSPSLLSLTIPATDFRFSTHKFRWTTKKWNKNIQIMFLKIPRISVWELALQTPKTTVRD